MMSRKMMLGMVVGAGILTAAVVLLTMQVGVWGGLLGFLVGVAESQWLFRDLRKAIKDELSRVLVRYLKSLVIRWGLVAVFVLLMIRYFAQGLFFMFIGFAVGIIVSAVVMARETMRKEKGGEK